MIEKLITLPVNAGYHIGKFGLITGAKAGKGVWDMTKNYIAPVLENVDDIDYASRLEKRGKNHDIIKLIEKKPEAKESLEDCISKAVEKHRTARKWAAVIDTVDKATAPIGAAGCYLILMTGTAGYTLGLAEEAAELALMKAPFMAYYAKKTGMAGAKRIPGWLAYEFASHVLPFGDILDLRNNYVNSVDKDIENYAANLFREQNGIQKQSWLQRLWNKSRKTPTATTNASDVKDQAQEDEQEDKKMQEYSVQKMPSPFSVDNRVKMYLDGLKEGSYESFMKQRREDIPSELERFVKWGFNPAKPNKWYTSDREYLKVASELADIADNFLEDKATDRSRKMISAHELEIAGEKKYVIEFENLTHEDYSKAHDVPPGSICPSVMVFVNRDYKLIIDAATGRIEDSHVEKKEYHTGLLDPLPYRPLDRNINSELGRKLDSTLETQVPELIEAGPKELPELAAVPVKESIEQKAAA